MAVIPLAFALRDGVARQAHSSVGGCAQVAVRNLTRRGRERGSSPQAAPIRDIIWESMPDARKNVPGFDAQTLEFEGAARHVYRAGVGPAVIVMSEIPGITPAVASFAQRLVDAGYTVFMPLLFGDPSRPPTPAYHLRPLGKPASPREF